MSNIPRGAGISLTPNGYSALAGIDPATAQTVLANCVVPLGYQSRAPSGRVILKRELDERQRSSTQGMMILGWHELVRVLMDSVTDRIEVLAGHTCECPVSCNLGQILVHALGWPPSI